MRLNLKIISLFTFLVIFLSACSSASAVQSWPGMTIDSNRQLLFVANQHNVYAINLSNSQLKWQFPEKEDGNKLFYAAPSLTPDGQLIVGGYDHKLYSINPENGQLLWTFEQAKGKYIASPLTTEKAIYASCTDENLYALDLKGNLLWSFHTKHAIWSKPVLHNGLLYLSAMDSHLYALNPDNGNMVWSTDMQGASVSSPTFDSEGNLYVGTFAKEMISMDSNGKIRWRTPTEGWVWSSPLLDDQQCYFGDISGNFYSLDKNSGAIKWKIFPSPAPITSSPVMNNQTIYFANAAENLYAVDKAGKVLWNVPIGASVHADLLLANNTIYAATDKTDALIIAFSLEGQQKWTFSPPKK